MELCGSYSSSAAAASPAGASSQTVKPTFTFDFAGKTVLVTGANRGLGLGFAAHFMAAGANVVAACRDPAKAVELHKLSPKPTILPLDIASEQSMEAFPKLLEDAGISSLDYLINNAGISSPNHPYDPILETTPTAMRDVFNVNVVGTVYLTQKILPFLEKGTKRTVVNLSSQLASIANCWAVQGRQGGVACYRMSRAAANMVTRCFGGELMAKGYIFVGMSPGHVATDMGSAGGRTAPLTVDESVSGMLSVIAGLRIGDNGKFLQYNGEDLPW
jgi:NAD(P)-dependent dehydrogenase (short-subunit alcohol dehydrogenase family)